jgi:hypothetical protein
MKQRVLSVVVSFLMVWNPVIAAIPGGPSDVGSIEAARQHIDRLSRRIEMLQAQLDRTQFDLDALLDRLDYDEQAIIRFVREEIAYELYEGLLRGASGTLMSRAGNALDQSVLLAKLLGDAGLETRIKGGRISPEQVERVLEELRHDAHAPPSPFLSADYTDAVDRLAQLAEVDAQRAERTRQQLQNPPSLSDDPVYQSSLASAELIRKELSKADVQLDDSEIGPELRREAAAFFWVEYRDGPASDWQVVQPIFREGNRIDELPKYEHLFVDEIPPQLQHRIRLQAFIEQKFGDRLRTHEITAPWERPAANLHAVPLTFTNIPQLLADGLNDHPDANTLLDESVYIAPALLGDSFQEFQAFDLAGNPIDSLVMGRGEAGVFKQVNRGMSEAAGALSGGKGPVALLTAQWLEFTFIAPGGKQKTVRRYTFDRLGRARRAAGEISAVSEDLQRPYSLLQSHTFMVATGDIPRSYTLNAALEQLLASRPLFDAINIAQHAPEKALEAISAAMKEMPAQWPGMTTLVHRLGEAEDLMPGRLVYRPAPALTVFSEGLVAEDRVQRIIDIVTNPRRIVGVANGTAKLDRLSSVLAGAWDTQVETGFLPSRTDDTMGTPRAFALALEQGIPLTLLRSPADLEALTLDEGTRLDLLADINDGYLALLPTTVPSGSELPAWWRIDPATGETLGVGSGGRGIALTEETVVTIATMFSLGALYYSWYGCFKDLKPGNAGSLTFLCCLVANLGLHLAGGSLGALIIGGWAGAIVSISYDVTSGFLMAIKDPCGSMFG